jgi:hypothetical protein
MVDPRGILPESTRSGTLHNILHIGNIDAIQDHSLYMDLDLLQGMKLSFFKYNHSREDDEVKILQDQP